MPRDSLNPPVSNATDELAGFAPLGVNPKRPKAFQIFEYLIWVVPSELFYQQNWSNSTTADPQTFGQAAHA